MAYSYFDYEGTDTTIQTDISCVSTEHMYAFKVLSEDNSNVTLGDVALAATFTKNNAGVLCELKTAPSTKIRVIRSTPYDVLMHDFSNGAQFNADSVDEVYEQLLYLCQEIVEGKLTRYSSAGCISKDDLQEQLANQYSLGYAKGETAGYAAGDAAGYNRGYNAGETVGDAAGYNRGYNAGETVGYNAGYNTGYNAGEAAGYIRGSSEVKPPEKKTDEYGRPIYPVTATITEYGKDSTGADNGQNITSQTVVYSYYKTPRASNTATRDNLSDPSIRIWFYSTLVDGYMSYTFKGEYNRHVSVSFGGA